MKSLPSLATYLIMAILVCPLIGYAANSSSVVSKKTDTDFLAPYVVELRNETPKENLEKISLLKETELWKLHHGYGTWIRNKWLYGNRRPELITYFLSKNFKQPDDMSAVLIKRLWQDLQKNKIATDKNAKSDCSKNYKLASMEFSPHDPYLKTVLSFSYGPEVNRFIPKLSGAISRFYYEGKEDNSKFTFFSTYYASKTDAQEAFVHLRKRVRGNKLQEAVLKNNQVVWFAGRNISEECFTDMKAHELKSL